MTRARWYDMPQQRGIVIELRSELGQNLPPVAGIESEIREALINLVFNAVDAMPEGGKLTIRTKTAQAATQHVDVEVADSGVGMDEETRRRCLEPFFTTKGERGTGLGLAMVYGVTRRHNADIEMESAVGQGTTVRLRFPVAVPSATDAQSAATPGHASAAAHSERGRRSAVDQVAPRRAGSRWPRRGDGQRRAKRASTPSARLKQRDEHFAVVITDLGMPYVDGRKVASAIKSDSPSTPVILLTGWGQRLVAEGDIPPHVDRVLNKPPKLKGTSRRFGGTCGSRPVHGARQPQLAGDLPNLQL